MNDRNADRYPEVGWMDRRGLVHHYADPPVMDEWEVPDTDYSSALAATPAVRQPDKPRLVADEPFWKKFFLIIPVMIIVAVIGARLAGYGFAALYYNLVETTGWATRNWHNLVPADWLRHPIRDVMFEKMPAFAALQVIVYNFGKHWPRKAPNRLDRIEGALRIPNQRIDNQGLLVLLLSPIWLLLYSGVGFAAIMTGLWLSGHTLAYPPTWEITLIGLAASFIFGRRIAKGVAYHAQRLVIRERIEDGKTRPAWWMLWPFRWRFEWNISHPEAQVKPATPWKHYRLQRVVHKMVLVALLLAGAFLIGQGFVILYQASHGPIAWGAAISAVKYAATAWF